MKASTSILFFFFAAVALFFFASVSSATDEFNFSGPVSVGNDTTVQEFFFTNNSYHYTPIQMTLFIESISNVENDGAFLIKQNFQIVDTVRGISLIVFSEDIEGTQETFTPITINQLFNPCLAEFLKTPSANLQFITAFDSNVTAVLEITYTLVIFNATIEDSQPVTVPTQPVQYFTYISTTFGLTTAFDLRIGIINTSPTNISDAFLQLTVGCSGTDGFHTFNLSQVDAEIFAANVPGVEGAVTISLSAINGTMLPPPDWQLVMTDAPDSSEDDGLEGWQIALIVVGCVAGAVLLAAAVGVVVWFVSRRSGYSQL